MEILYIPPSIIYDRQIGGKMAKSDISKWKSSIHYWIILVIFFATSCSVIQPEKGEKTGVSLKTAWKRDVIQSLMYGEPDAPHPSEREIPRGWNLIESQQYDYISDSSWIFDTGWVKGRSIRFTYDANGTIKEVGQDPSGPNFDYKKTYIFDKAKNLIQELEQNKQRARLINTHQIFSTYDDEGRCQQVNTQFWHDSIWVDGSDAKYSYDTKGELTQRLAKDFDYLVAGSKELYTYDSNGNLIEELWQVWRGDSIKWKNNDRKTFTYEEHGKRLEQLHQVWQDDHWSEDTLSKLIMLHDSTGRIISRIRPHRDWIEWTYDTNGNILELDSKWMNNRWVMTDETIFKYDENGCLVEKVGLTPKETAWVASSKVIFMWDKIQDNEY